MVASFSALDVLVRKKNMRLARFSLHFARNQMTPCVPIVHRNHYASTYFILLSDRLIFRNSLTQVNRMSRSRRVLAIGGKQRFFGLDMVFIETILFHLESF